MPDEQSDPSTPTHPDLPIIRPEVSFQTQPPSTPAGKSHLNWHYLLLWLIALVSLGLNFYLVYSLVAFRAEAQKQVAEASAFLDTVEISNFDLPIVVDETLPISMTVTYSDTFQVPISNTVPVSLTVQVSKTLTVPIDVNIPVNTTVSVPVPAFGNVPIPIPIVTNIPVNFDVQVPISLSIPISNTIPVQMAVEVPVQSEIPINTSVPVKLDFPVTIPLDELGFNTLLQQVKDALRLLAQALGE